MNSEFRTLVGLVVLLAALFFWLDYREVRHDEISLETCAELHDKWNSRYRSLFEMKNGLNVETFECPSRVSGMALALRFLETTKFSKPKNEPAFDFFAMLQKTNATLGDRPGDLFLALATYSSNRIDIHHSILESGDPVEIGGALIHEARHLQQGNNTHVPCFWDSQLTCDARMPEELIEGGAYSYTVLFYDRVLRFSNANSQAKRSASSHLQGVLDLRFNAIKPELRARYAP